jgi:DNA-3-methyladenine glycosylase
VGPAASTTVAREELARDALDVAPRLLNKLLVHGDRIGRIVEVEAYRGEDDPASHAFRGPTGRTTVMFGPAGYLYVYFTYGMHWCANVVCGTEGVAQAVLLRAIAPVAGVEAMWAARPAARREIDLGNGPAKLCQALGITGELNGGDLVKGPVRLADDGVPPPRRPSRGTRIGITAASERPWRWWVPGDPHVSKVATVRSEAGRVSSLPGNKAPEADRGVDAAPKSVRR